jgi:K+-transporting ATPase ATPase A chain
MSLPALVQDLAFLIAVVVLVRPLGGYMARVFTREQTLLDPVLLPVERILHRTLGVDPETEMTWSEYALSFLVFSLCATLLVYALLRLQRFLPFYEAARVTTPMTPDLAFNTAVSFSTTTTWQAYAGETTMSPFSQVAALASQNFLGGAAGLSVGVAFIRGLARRKSSYLGNFWVDLVRSTLWVLLPLALLSALVLVWQGVPANFHPYAEARTLEDRRQVIPQGPVAALEGIKNLSTNGEGYFNANSAHPYEAPTPLANFLLLLAIAAVPASLTRTFGLMLGRPRHGRILLWAMLALFIAALVVCHQAESTGSPALARAGLAHAANLEGKETRFGVGGSALAAVMTSGGASGSFNSMHDSFTAVGGLIPLFNMLLGEIAFGGLGFGLTSLLLVAFLGLFAGGLMVGKTPEYAGKVIGAPEMKLVMLYTLAAPLAILIPTAVAVRVPAGLAGLTVNSGPHGFTEVLFAFASCFANNGQTFAGLSANSVFYNVATAISMMVGRFGLAVPVLALAGRFALQGRRPQTAGTLRTDSFVFALLLVATAVFVGALSYFPAVCLGPLAEHLSP